MGRLDDTGRITFDDGARDARLGAGIVVRAGPLFVRSDAAGLAGAYRDGTAVDASAVLAATRAGFAMVVRAARATRTRSRRCP